MFIATCTGLPSPRIVSTYHYTNGSIKIAGKPNEICELKVKTDTDYQVFAAVKFRLLSCPKGFVYTVLRRKNVNLLYTTTTRINSAISGCDLILNSKPTLINFTGLAMNQMMLTTF